MTPTPRPPLAVRRDVISVAGLLVFSALASACGVATSGRLVRAASDTPDHFLVGTLEGGASSEPVAGEGCRNPMIDPRDGAKLRLLSAQQGLGDYEVPAGRYGVAAGAALRIACATGRAIGVVTR